MTWTINIHHTRPNTNVEFYKDPEHSSLSYLNASDQSHVTSTYRDTGRLVSTSHSLSENGLELTKTFVYRDEPSKNAYVNDSIIQAWLSARDVYNTSNNIIKVIIQNEAT